MSHGTTAPLTTAPPLAMATRINLSIMMFLQFAVWGAWFVTLGNYLGEKGLGFDNAWIGSIFGTMALGTIFTPMIVGAVADRYFASEKLMAILHLAGAGLLYWMAHAADPWTFYMAALLYALVYSPTLALANSITFSHVPDGGRDFPSIRVLGTIGWILAGLAIGYLLPRLFPAEASTIDNSNKPLLMAALLSGVLGVYSFFLPHTPPTGKAGDPMPALKAIGLLREFSFAVFFGVSFIITIVLAFYYAFTGLFLEASIFPKLAENVRPESVAPIMSIGQVSEMIFLPFLPWFLYRLGMKYVLALGMLAWGLRYFLFALGDAGQVGPWVVIASLAFHGICFDFFFAAGFIHVDRTAPPQVRASGQALFTFLTYGLAMWLGNTISGYVVDRHSLWNRAGGEVVFKQVVDDLYSRRDVTPTEEDKKSLLKALKDATSGNPKALSALGSDQTAFDRLAPDLKRALTEKIADPKEAELAYQVIAYQHATFLYNQTVKKLKAEDVPKSEWPPKPVGPDYRNWYMIWLIPSIGVLASLLIFLVFFHLPPTPRPSAVDASRFAPSGKTGAIDAEGVIAPATLTKPHDPPGP